MSDLFYRGEPTMCPQNLSFLTHAPAIALALMLQSFSPCFNLTRNCRFEAHNLQRVGWQHYQQQRWVQAEQTFQQVLVLQRTVGDAVGVVDALIILGLIAYQRGELAQAVSYSQQAFRLSKSVNYATGMGISASNIGWLYRQMGKWSWALCAYQHALKAYVETDDYATVGQTLYQLGMVYADLDQPAQAQQYRWLASQISQETLDSIGELTQRPSLYERFTLQSVNLPNSDTDEVDPESAHYLANVRVPQSAIAVHDEVQLGRDKANKTPNRLYQPLNAPPVNATPSSPKSQEMLETYKSLSDLRQEATTLHTIAALYQRDGLYLSALAYEKQALSLFQLIGDRTEIDQILHNLGKIHERLGHRKTAMKYYGQVLKNLFKLLPWQEDEYSSATV